VPTIPPILRVQIEIPMVSFEGASAVVVCDIGNILSTGEGGGGVDLLDGILVDSVQTQLLTVQIGLR
jgi:hypothetical protein